VLRRGSVVVVSNDLRRSGFERHTEQFGKY
jgi:hypothetical protein